jgi:hypothetical protein
MAYKPKPKAKAKPGITNVGGGYKPNPTVAPVKPAYGTYDPTLDQQERAAGRGLGDLVADIGTANRRATTDLTLGTQNIDRTAGRSLADLLNARTRGLQDYTTNTTDRSRQYGVLAGQQGERMAAAGILGGAIEQARQKRTANQALEQGQADQQYSRFLTDSTTGQTRLAEDQSLGIADLNLGFQRGWQDRNEVQLPRAQRENTFFGQDINELRVDQAKQAGMLPDTPLPTVTPKKRKTYVGIRRSGGRPSAAAVRRLL